MKHCVLSSTPKLIPGFCLFPGIASSLPHASPNAGGSPPAPQVPPTGYLTKLDKSSPTWALTLYIWQRDSWDSAGNLFETDTLGVPRPPAASGGLRQTRATSLMTPAEKSPVATDRYHAVIS